MIQLYGSSERGNGQEALDRVEIWGVTKMVQEGEYRLPQIVRTVQKETLV